MTAARPMGSSCHPRDCHGHAVARTRNGLDCFLRAIKLVTSVPGPVARIPTYRGRKFDVVTYVPSIQPNYGLKHAATRLGKLKDLPFKEPLAKIKQNHPQRDFNSTVLRRENVRRVFTVRPDHSVDGASVLLIDDLFDSGETLREACRVLLHAGAEEVCVLVVAKTNGLME